jgi:hypothetical protein
LKGWGSWIRRRCRWERGCDSQGNTPDKKKPAQWQAKKSQVNIKWLSPTLGLDQIGEYRNIDVISLVGFVSPEDCNEEANRHDTKANEYERGNSADNVNKKPPDECLYVVGLDKWAVLLIFHQ